MHPQLCIFRGKSPKYFFDKQSVHFAVIDQDKTEVYPANFICILPQHMSLIALDSSIFSRIFKERRIEMAKKLLKDALQTESDPQIKKAITERLRQLEPKSLSLNGRVFKA